VVAVAVAEAVAHQRASAREREIEYRGLMAGRGVEFVDPTPAERASFAASVAGVVARARATYGAGLYDLIES
jgi:TRAP-type C4-dicarboxylate transport system substrate-binding protein